MSKTPNFMLFASFPVNSNYLVATKSLIHRKMTATK